ncbi:MAG TPA: LEA type 2 family protein [Anaeromyxobacteraceae bacterium]|nr:LEA type 2 family protein [Anaeromyxobacteraceae bacterium]
MRLTRNLALAALVLCAGGCAFLQRLTGAGLEPPRLTYQSWAAEQLDLEGVTIALHYRLENPNGFGLDLRRLTYQLDVEGRQVGEGSLPAGVQVPAQGATDVAIPVRLRWRDVPGFVEILLSRAEVAYRVRGSAGVGSALGTIDLPFDHQGRVAVPRPPSIGIEGVTVKDASLAHLAVDVKLGIENGNSFPLPVGALTYGLRVGEQELLEGGAHPLVAVPPRGHAVVTVPIRLSTLGAAEGISELLRGAALRLHGRAGFGDVQVPVDAQGAVTR